jgi:small conductance mechanosensitive channel
MDALLERLQVWGEQYGLKVLGALIIFIIGRWVAKIISKIVRRVMEKAEAAPILMSFVERMVYFVLLVFVIVAALSKLGMQTASMVAVLGAAGLAVGLALQGSLANFAAGVLIIVFRPFRVGHFIEAAGTTGTVEDIDIFTTQLATPDNKTEIIPNGTLMSGTITNYTVKGTRRIDMVIGVAYDADLAKTKQVLMDVIKEDERVLDDPEPVVAVLNLGDSSVDFAVRPWVSADDYWSVLFDTLEKAKNRLDAEGIGIPFPQQDVHLYQHTAE